MSSSSFSMTRRLPSLSAFILYYFVAVLIVIVQQSHGSTFDDSRNASVPSFSSSLLSSWYSFLRGGRSDTTLTSSSVTTSRTIRTRRNLQTTTSSSEEEGCRSFLTDHTYQIVDIYDEMSLHVAGDSLASGVSIVKKTAVSGSSISNKWRLEKATEDGQYYVINENSGLSITLDDSSTIDPQNTVVQLPVSEDGSSTWCFQDGGGGSYRAVSLSRGRTLVVSNSLKWIIIPVETETLSLTTDVPTETPGPVCAEMNVNVVYRITARYNGKPIQMQDDTKSKGGLIAQGAYDSESQSSKWSLKKVTDTSTDDNLYRLININSGLDIRVRRASKEPGAVLQQHNPNEKRHGNFCFENVEGWYYQIKIQHSELYVEAVDESPRLVQEPYSAGSLQQQFLMTPIKRGAYTKVPGAWEGPYPLPIVAVAVANIENGNILMWAAFQPGTFGGSGRTYTTIFDPTTKNAPKELIRDTKHDMFCPGTAVLDDERILITGGSNSEKTTIYDPRDDTWRKGKDMNIPRGYQAMTVLGDGTVFVLGGSFSGGLGDKHGELWDPKDGSWKLKRNIRCEGTLLTDDVEEIYRSDNHMWLFTAPNGLIFHAGPSFHMHWINVTDDGEVIPSMIQRGNEHAMNGNAVMYDIGKILTLGGAPNYKYGADAYKTAYIIDINGEVGVETVQRTGDMLSRRTFSTSVVLPTSDVVVTGGMIQADVFTDVNHVLFAEIWNPKTGVFLPLPNMRVPRTYHGVAILMKDGRILVAGGGLCTAFCPIEYNHFDTEIFTPPYLLNDDGTSKRAEERPTIVSAPKTAADGDMITVTMDTGMDHTFALMRLGAVTHSINNDGRRIPLPLQSKSGDSNFNLKIPENPSVALPGTYFLFAMNSAGTPSIGHTIAITTSPASDT